MLISRKQPKCIACACKLFSNMKKPQFFFHFFCNSLNRSIKVFEVHGKKVELNDNSNVEMGYL